MELEKRVNSNGDGKSNGKFLAAAEDLGCRVRSLIASRVAFETSVAV